VINLSKWLHILITTHLYRSATMRFSTWWLNNDASLLKLAESCKPPLPTQDFVGALKY